MCSSCVCPPQHTHAPAGFGIIFDTFRNAELSHIHKDVAYYVNAGGVLDPTVLKDVTGCDADFRYWQGRDDFSVANKSVAKITFDVSARVCGGGHCLRGDADEICGVCCTRAQTHTHLHSLPVPERDTDPSRAL